MTVSPDDVLKFWFEEAGPHKWFETSDVFEHIFSHPIFWQFLITGSWLFGVERFIFDCVISFLEFDVDGRSCFYRCLNVGKRLSDLSQVFGSVITSPQRGAVLELRCRRLLLVVERVL